MMLPLHESRHAQCSIVAPGAQNKKRTTMNDTRRKRHMIRIDQLCVGLHVKLAGWLDHPFLFSNFKISSQDQIDALQAMGLDEIEYLPFKSDAIPRPAAARALEAGAA